MKVLKKYFNFQDDGFIRKEIAIKSIAMFVFINFITLLPDLFHIFGEFGMVQNEVNQKYIFWYQPVLNGFINAFKLIGLNSRTTLMLFVIGYVYSIICLFFNYKRFLSAIVVWFIHFVFINSTYLFSYGADYFIIFLLFVNMIICSTYVIKKIEIQKIVYSFSIKFLQIHLCLVYFFAGFGKALGSDWYDGNAIWAVINVHGSESLAKFSLSLIEYPIFFKILAIGTVILELFYPFLIFNKYSKKITLSFIVLLHAGIGIFMGLYTFAIVMILLNLIAFGHHIKLFNYIFFIKNHKKNLSTETQLV